MSQDITAETGFSGDVPANLVCGFCRKPIAGEFYRALNRFGCPSCAAKLQNVIDRNAFSPEPFARAAGAGLVTALACAAAWAAIVQATHFEIGIVASFIGVAVGKVVHVASGKRRGRALQFLAAGLSVLGILGGKMMLVGWQLVDQLNQRNIPIDPLRLTRAVISIVIEHPTAIFGGFDLLWIAFALYAAWRICQAPPITIAGPYLYSPPGAGAGAGAADMQFHTVEPATPEVSPEASPESSLESPSEPEQP